MTDYELDEIEKLADRLSGLDLEPIEDRDAAIELRELLEDVPWLVAEVRRLRNGPGKLGALLRWKRMEAGKSVTEVAHAASEDPAAGSVSISPEEVRALEEGTHPTGPRWPDMLQAIANVLGIRTGDLPRP
jgi:hypothetical protein